MRNRAAEFDAEFFRGAMTRICLAVYSVALMNSCFRRGVRSESTEANLAVYTQ